MHGIRATTSRSDHCELKPSKRDYYVAIANYYSLTAPAVWLQAPKTPFGYMGELGEERLHCGTGFGDRYRVPKVTSVAAFCV